MKTFIDPDLLDRLRVGPLSPYLDAYLKRIEQEGFLPSSVPMHVCNRQVQQLAQLDASRLASGG
jgi:hypothetical protein